MFKPIFNYALYECNHKDGNKLNNYINNLEWCTRSENQKHAYKIASYKKINESINKQCNFIRQKKEKIIMMQEYIDIEELSKLIHLSITTINRLVKMNKVPTYKIGKRRLYNKAEILVWMKEKKEN